MKNIIRILFCSALLIFTTNVKADVQFGIGGQLGLVDTAGTETEGTAADTSNRSTSFEELFVGADLKTVPWPNSCTAFIVNFITVPWIKIVIIQHGQLRNSMLKTESMHVNIIIKR